MAAKILLECVKHTFLNLKKNTCSTIIYISYVISKKIFVV